MSARFLMVSYRVPDGDFKSEVQQPLQWMEVEG